MFAVRNLTLKALTIFVTPWLFLTSPEAMAGISIELQENPALAFTQEQLELHLAAINRRIAPLAPPSTLKITVGSKFSESVFDRNTFRLYAGLKSTPEQLAVLTHEYGHAVLEAELLKNPAYQEFHKNAASLSADRENHKPGVDRTQKLYVISSALHEFFADVFTVTLHQDPQSLRKVTLPEKKDLQEGSWDDLTTRDFVLSPHSVRKTEWQKILPFVTFTGDVYVALLPSRWEYWRLAGDQINASVNSRLAGNLWILHVYQSVEKVMLQALTWDESELRGKKLEPEMILKLNDLLIQELRLFPGFSGKQEEISSRRTL